MTPLRQRTFEKQRRFPPPKYQLPSCRSRASQHPLPRPDFRQREGDQGTAEALRCQPEVGREVGLLDGDWGVAEALCCQPEVGCEVVLLDWDWSVAEARCCQPEVGCEVVLLDWDWNVAEARCCQL